MIVHLVDGTYELFRHFYGLRRFTKGKDRPYGAVVGVLVVLFAILLPVTYVVAWAHYVVLNNKGFERTVVPIGTDPAVTQALAAG